jgi:hypothetical protein
MLQSSQPTSVGICLKGRGIIYYNISSTNKWLNGKGQWGAELVSQKLCGC